MVWECPRNGLGMLLLHPGIRSPIPLFSSSPLGRSLRGLLSFPAFLWEREQDFVTFHHSQTFFGKGEQDSMAFHHSHLSSGRGPPHSHSPSPPGPDPSQSLLILNSWCFFPAGIWLLPSCRPSPAVVGRRRRRQNSCCCCSCFFLQRRGPSIPGKPSRAGSGAPAPGKRNPGGGNPSPAPRDPRGTKNVTALFPTFPGSFSFGRLWILSFLAFRHEFKSGSRWIFRACLGNSMVGGREGEKGGILWEDPSAPRRRGKALILTGELRTEPGGWNNLRE